LQAQRIQVAVAVVLDNQTQLQLLVRLVAKV